MKFCRYLLLITLLPLLSCGGDSEDNGLAISVTPSETFLLPGDEEVDDGCYDNTFSENHLQFQELKTQWTGNGDFLPIVVTIELRDGTDSQTCTITDEEASSLGVFLGYGGTELSEVDSDNDGNNDGVEAESLCSLRCGGFTADENATFSTEIKLIGIQTTTDDEGNETQVPVSTSTTVRVRSLEL